MLDGYFKEAGNQGQVCQLAASGDICWWAKCKSWWHLKSWGADIRVSYLDVFNLCPEEPVHPAQNSGTVYATASWEALLHLNVSCFRCTLRTLYTTARCAYLTYTVSQSFILCWKGLCKKKELQFSPHCCMRCQAHIKNHISYHSKGNYHM